MGKRILVIEDDTNSRETLADLLIEKGFEVLQSEDADAALDILDKCGVDLIILDMVLPGMNGYKLYEHIRKNDKTASVPVIMLSGKEPLDKMLEKSKESAFSYVVKSTKPEKLLIAVESALTGHIKPKIKKKWWQINKDD